MPSAGASDKDLVLACQNGDMAAFEALYRTYFSSVYDFAARTMKDRHAAADVVQEAFIKAHAKIDQLRNPEAFRPWLYSIVRREALNGFRDQNRAVVTSTLESDDAAAPNTLLSQAADDLADDPVAAAELSDSASLVWDAAASLDADTYTVLDLHVRQGLTSAEIAEVLGISKGNAYTKVNRMKERTGAAISTYLLIRKGSKDCDELTHMVSNVPVPPVTPKLRRAVDRHTRDCETCEKRRKALVSPMSIFAAMAAVPPPVGLEAAIWQNVIGATSGGGGPTSRRLRLILGLVVFLVVLIGGATAVGVARSGQGQTSDAVSPPQVLGVSITRAPETDSTTSSDAADTSTSSAVGGSVSDSTETSSSTSAAADTTAAPVDTTSAPPVTASTPPPPTDTTITTAPVPPPTTPPDTTPPTTPPDTTPPTTPPDTTPPTTPPDTTPPTTPPDTTPPALGQVITSPGAIWELDDPALACPAGTVRVSTISIDVTDDSTGVASVTASWTIGGSGTQKAMTPSGSTYSAQFGAFPYLTVPDNTSPSISIFITATDSAGNQSNTSDAITVNSLAKCFG